MRLGGSIAIAVVLGLGCGDKAASADKGAGSAGPGLEDAANDKAVVTAAKAALACEWSASGLKYDCPAHNAWKESPLLKEGKADPTLVAMLGDAKEQVRWLGAEALSSHGKAYEKDPALAARVVAAAQAEKQPLVGGALGRAAGKIDAAATKQDAALKALAKDHALVELRRSLVQNVLWTNRATFYDFVVDLARKDPNPEVRKAAISGPWTGTPSGRENDSCALWLEKMDDTSQEVGGEAAYLCAFYPHGGGCKAHWDPMLGKLDARARAGKVQSSQFASALSWFHGQKAASATQKKRAIAIAKALVENAANAGMARGNALRFIGEVDDGAKVYAKRFVGDKEFFVKSTAKDIDEGKIKKK